MNISKIFTAAFLFLFTSIYLPLSASDVDLTSSVGNFFNEVGNPTSFSNTQMSDGTTSTSLIKWGIPAGTNQSGYNFSTIAPINDIVLETPFQIGVFTHLNYPIFGNALTSVDLGLVTSFSVNGSPAMINTSYAFSHNETPNIATSSDPNCCNDIVSFEHNFPQGSIFEMDGVIYTLGLVGFKTSPEGPLLTQFSTVEGQSNTAMLYGQVSRVDVLIPEPSTYLIMASLLAACTLVAHRRKKQTKS